MSHGLHAILFTICRLLHAEQTINIGLEDLLDVATCVRRKLKVTRQDVDGFTRVRLLVTNMRQYQIEQLILDVYELHVRHGTGVQLWLRRVHLFFMRTLVLTGAFFRSVTLLRATIFLSQELLGHEQVRHLLLLGALLRMIKQPLHLLMFAHFVSLVCDSLRVHQARVAHLLLLCLGRVQLLLVTALLFPQLLK